MIYDFIVKGIYMYFDFVIFNDNINYKIYC